MTWRNSNEKILLRIAVVIRRCLVDIVFIFEWFKKGQRTVCYCTPIMLSVVSYKIAFAESSVITFFVTVSHCCYQTWASILFFKRRSRFSFQTMSNFCKRRFQYLKDLLKTSSLSIFLRICKRISIIAAISTLFRSILDQSIWTL